MIAWLAMGAALGLSAGMAPGPLMTLVVSESLRRGGRAGVRVALAPVITDLPIVLLSLLVLSRLSAFQAVLGAVSLLGGGYVLYLGLENLRAGGAGADMTKGMKQGSLSRGVLTNFLSPHPYLFWLSVGAPAVTRAMKVHPGAAAAFILGFYLCLVGSKVGLALLAGRSRAFFGGRAYTFVMRFLGLALCLLAALLLYDGTKMLGLPRP